MKTLCFAVAAFVVLFSGAAAAEPPPLSFGRPNVCTSDYPPEAAAAGHEGTVRLAFTITDKGTVADPKVDVSSGYPELDAAALACVKDWRYRPAMQNGKPISVPWMAVVNWSLSTPEQAQLNQALAQALAQAMKALNNEASRCLYASDAAKIAPPGFDGMTMLSLGFHNGGDGQVSIKFSSGNAALDEIAAACFRNAPSLKKVRTVVNGDHDYGSYVPWKSVLHPAPPP